MINIGALFKGMFFFFPVKTYFNYIYSCVSVQQKSDNNFQEFSPTMWVRSSALTASGFYLLSYL